MLELLYKSHSLNVHAGIITYKQPFPIAQILLSHDEEALAVIRLGPPHCRGFTIKLI